MRKIDIINKAKSVLYHRQTIAEDRAKDNFKKAKSLKDFDKIYVQYQDSLIALAKANALHLDTSNIKKEFEKQKLQLEKILASENLTLSDLKPNYFCKKCMDTGLHNGTQCQCLTDEIKLIEANLLKLENFLGNSLEQINSDVVSEKFKKQYELILNKLKRASSSFPNVNMKLYCFMGKAGTGKTFLAKAFANSIYYRGFDTIFISTFSLNEAFLKYHSNFNDNNAIGIRPFIQADVLVIDDLGQEPARNNITNEYLLTLLNERSQFGKLTIFTTNFDMTTLSKFYSNAISSRIMDTKNSACINFDFEDLRIKEKIKREK